MKNIIKTRKIIIRIITICLLTLIIVGANSYEKYIVYKKDYLLIEKELKKLYLNNIPRKNIKIKDINNISTALNNIKEISSRKNRYKIELNNLKRYIDIENQIDKIYINNTLISTTSITKIKNISKEIKKLPDNYQIKLNKSIENMMYQKKQIDDVDKEITYLFENHSQTNIKKNITMENINKIKSSNSNIKQRDIYEKNESKILLAQKQLMQREVEKERENDEKTKNAWHVLDVPYISQNKNNILNGCEAASLLMGLQYKGYLTNMDLLTYSINMPKSESNAYEGFTHDIFGLYPMSVPHWIAPAPLSNYGKITSGADVIDGTGYTLDQLDQELDKNNPVVIYVTAKFKEPKEVIEGAPKNIHVQLLVGYNKISGDQMIVDPWTHDDGRKGWTMPKKTVESIYNAVGKKSVIIR